MVGCQLSQKAGSWGSMEKELIWKTGKKEGFRFVSDCG
jgi:hypothetical protein